MGIEWTAVKLSESDYDAVLALWQDAQLSIRPEGRDSREQFSSQIGQDTQVVLGVHNGDRLIGVIVATHDGRKGWLNRLAVHPDYRRRGVGMYLVQAAEQALLDRGLRIIATLVEDWNHASLALMTRAGYEMHSDIIYLTKREHEDV